MLLRQVYEHNKWLFFLMIIFVVGQLFINFKHGLTISPFYHYGMYSQAFTPQKTYQVFEVKLNGQTLRGQDFSSQQWDKIMLPLQYYSGINKSNSLYYTDGKRILEKLHLSASERNFLSVCNYGKFENWYKNYLAQVTNQQISSLKVTYRTFTFNAGRLAATDTTIPLIQLCR